MCRTGGKTNFGPRTIHIKVVPMVYTQQQQENNKISREKEQELQKKNVPKIFTLTKSATSRHIIIGRFICD